jgi:hypothetical protein
MLHYLAILVFSLETFAAGSAQIQTLFGPKAYFRTEGKPLTKTDFFRRCESGAEYKLVVNNSELEKSGLDRSATIYLNGKLMVGPSDFNAKTVIIEKPVKILNENTLATTLQGKPGSSVTIAIACVARCLDLSIDSPSDQEVSASNRIPVVGKYSNSSSEISVRVNGEVADIQEGHFAIPGFMLTRGFNLIEAEIKNACSERIAKKSRVTYSEPGDGPGVFITATPSNGTAPLVSSLRVRNTHGAGYAGVEWDFNGDGIVDTAGPLLLEVDHAFPTPGIYQPRVILKDVSGSAFMASTIVNVIAKDRLTGLLQGKWDLMFSSILAHDTATALQLLDPEVREEYKAFFLNPVSIPLLSALAGKLEFKELYGPYATFNKKVLIDGMSKDVFVKFKMDDVGFWKIRFF